MANYLCKKIFPQRPTF